MCREMMDRAEPRSAELRGPIRSRRRERVVEFLGLERNVTLVAGTMFLMSLGEELWKRFVPKYLEALGAPVVAIGLYGTARDFLDGVYQYPGGWVADRYGRRRALLLFVMLAAMQIPFLNSCCADWCVRTAFHPVVRAFVSRMESYKSVYAHVVSWQCNERDRGIGAWNSCCTPRGTPAMEGS